MPEFVEYYIDQGSDFSSTLNLTDSVTSANANLTGYSVNSQIRRSYFSSNISARFTCQVTNALQGEITLSLNSANTSNLKVGRHVFDVYTTDATNSKARVLEGTITVTPGVTR